MDTAVDSGIYSCDDHLDLAAVPPAAVGVAPLAARTPNAGRAWSSGDKGASVGVRGPRHRPQRHAGATGARSEGLERDRPRRHRRRRLPRRDARAAARGHGPRRARGVGDLRTALARVPDRRSRAAGRVLRGVERLGGRGVQRGRARPAVRARVPARSLARGRGRRARALRGDRSPRRDHRRLRRRPRRPGVGPAVVGAPRTPGCRSASTSRAARRRSSATRSASGSRPRSRRCCRCSSTSRSPHDLLAARSNGTRGCSSCSPSRASAGCRTSSPAWTWSGTRCGDKLDYAPTIAPSELFRRQVIATFEEEPLAEQFIPLLGADSCMWASDYPHTDSTFPESRRAIEETLGALPDDDVRKITATNCARLYGFPRCRVSGRRASTTCRCRCSDTDAMVAFYRALGFDVDELSASWSVHVGDQMINFHRPEMWPRGDFTLRAPRRGAAVRRPLLRVGRVAEPRSTPCSIDAGVAVEEVRSRARRPRRRRHRACTSAIPTATCSSS